MGKIKTVFFCGHKSPYGLAHLEPLLKSEFDVIAVIVATDKRWTVFIEKLCGKGYSSEQSILQKIKSTLKKAILTPLLFAIRGEDQKSADVRNVAKKYQTPVLCVDNVNSESFIQRLQETQPDLIISAAYPQIFSKKFISVPKKGAVNFHPSLLPKFRGAHPHYWTIVKGEIESGLTAHFMTERIDDGDIISQIRYPIKNFSYEDLYNKMIGETPNLVLKVQEYFIKGIGKVQKQDESNATYFKNDRDVHHRIFWNLQDVETIYNLTRTGMAYCFFRNIRNTIVNCTILETNREWISNTNDQYGSIVDFSKDSIVLHVKNGCISVKDFVYKGKNMSASNFIKEFRVKIGEKFE